MWEVMWETAARALLLVNGAYDLVCAISIAADRCYPFSHLHTDMFADREVFRDAARRNLLAHWIFLNGLVRLAAGARPAFIAVAACTYLLEIHCLSSMHHELVLWKHRGVVAMSLACAALSFASVFS